MKNKNITEINDLGDIREILIWNTAKANSNPVLTLNGNTLLGIASHVREKSKEIMGNIDETKKKVFVIDKLYITFDIMEISDIKKAMLIFHLIDPKSNFSIFKVEFVYKNDERELYILPNEIIKSNWKECTDIELGLDQTEDNPVGGVSFKVDVEKEKRGL